MSDEDKKKSSDAHSFQKKPIVLLDKNENIISEYDSISQASKLTGISAGNISKCCRGILKSINGQVWKYKYEEDCFIGATKSRSKQVIQFDKNYIMIAEYSSMSEAERITRVSVSSIGACCRHKRLTAGGFIWRYADESNRNN